MITALEYQETDWPLYVVWVCVWRDHNTQSLLSLLLFTSSGRSQKPPSSCMQQHHEHTHRRTLTHAQTHCQCPSVHQHTVSSCVCCQLLQRAALSHLWFGFNPNNLRVTHWVTWWSNWMGGFMVRPAHYPSSFLVFFFLCKVFYWFLLQCLVTPIDVTKSLSWAASSCLQSQRPFLSNVEVDSFVQRWG